jgi:hypothetical protein
MKFALPIKFFQAGCVAAAIGFGTMSAEAQTSNLTGFTFPPIGTIQKVTDYAVRNVNVITLFTWVYNTDSQSWVMYYNVPWYGSPNYLTNKAQMDQFIATELTNIMSSVITNTIPNINKDKGIYLSASCGILVHDLFLLSYDNLYAYQQILLIKNPNGSYSVPDLSSFSTTLADSISFYVPNLQWARVEVGYKGESYPFEVDDELYEPGSNPIGSDRFLYLPMDYITDSSSNSGDFWMKITLFDNNTFQIFNGDGNQIPETPMVLALNQHGTNATVTVNGGDQLQPRHFHFSHQRPARCAAQPVCLSRRQPLAFLPHGHDQFAAQIMAAGLMQLPKRISCQFADFAGFISSR